MTEADIKLFLDNLLKEEEKPVDSIQKIATARYTDYMKAVVQGRAIPDIRDGLKPVQRRILYAMKDLSLTPSGAPKKSARIVGHVIGLYHPHGDSSVYEAMVALAQPWNKRLPLVKGQGNFGSIDDDSAAAMRYTEAKFSETGAMFFENISHNVVDMVPNYDSSEEKPSVLPVPFPHLLINGATGIAAGVAAEIPPHNPQETLLALLEMVERKKKKQSITPEELAKIIKGPDFPTGGVIYGLENFSKIIATGKGGARLRAKYTVEDAGRGKKAIVVTEIPYRTIKTNIIVKIADLHKEKIITDLAALRDESSHNDIRIYIELKKGADPESVWSKLCANTDLDVSFSYNFTAVNKGKFEETNPLKAIEDFIDFRVEITIRKNEDIKKKAELRLHVVKALITALENIDDIVAILKSSKKEEDAIQKLKEKFSFSEIQSKAILAMRMQRLIGLEKLIVEKERDELEKTIARAEKIIKSKTLQYNEIIKETKTLLRKMPYERISAIDNSIAESVSGKQTSIKKEDFSIYIDEEWFLYSKEPEKYVYKIDLNTHDNLLIATEDATVFSISAADIYQSDARFWGSYVDNRENSRAIGAAKDSGFILLSTSKGFVKQTEAKAFVSKKKTGVSGAKLSEESLVLFENADKEFIVMVSEEERPKIIKFSLNKVSKMGRSGRGVRGMAAEKMASVFFVNDDETVSTTKSRKKIIISKLKKQNRAGKGTLI